MQQPRIAVVVLQKTLSAPVLHRRPGSALPVPMSTVSLRAKPSLDVSQQSPAEAVALTSPQDPPRVCPQVDDFISLLPRDKKRL